MMSPLAKSSRSTPGLCERFEVFVGTKEIINAYVPHHPLANTAPSPLFTISPFRTPSTYKLTQDVSAQLHGAERG